jgi:hypothetical protein
MSSPEALFQLANTLVLPFWLLLAIFPKNRWTRLIVVSGGASCLIAAFYIMALTKASSEFSLEAFATLSGIRQAFGDEWFLLAGWIHYLAFDLYVGAKIASEHTAMGSSHLGLVVKLFFTMMLGPIGLILHKVHVWIRGVLPHS